MRVMASSISQVRDWLSFDEDLSLDQAVRDLPEEGDAADINSHDVYKVESQELLCVDPKTLAPVQCSAVQCSGEFDGTHNFVIEIYQNPNKPASYLEVSSDNKLFIKPNCTLSILVHWDKTLNLHLRSSLEFVNPKLCENPVVRCKQHKQTDSEDDHVMICESLGAVHEKHQKRCSIKIGLLPNEDGIGLVNYKFLCLNTCALGGIARADTRIVFTLENELGEVLGRKTINLKICENPRRDCNNYSKQLQSSQGKRRRKREVCAASENAPPTSSKKFFVEAVSAEASELIKKFLVTSNLVTTIVDIPES